MKVKDVVVSLRVLLTGLPGGLVVSHNALAWVLQGGTTRRQRNFDRVPENTQKRPTNNHEYWPSSLA